MGATGRQKGKVNKQAQETLSDPAAELEEVMANGKPKMNGTVGKMDERIEKEENIFLFVPNVIGRSKPRAPYFTKADHTSSRLLPNHPGHRLPLLHAPPPPNMLPPLLDLLPPRRP